MADTKISALPAASTPLTGSEVVPLNQSGVTSNVTVANLTAGRNITFNNTLPGYTATATAAGTTTLTSSSTYHQRFTGSSAQTIVLPAATTMAQGQGFIIDNDSSGTLTLQDGSTASLGSVTPGMAVYVFCENNSTTAGSWSGYMFVPGSGPGGQVTWGTTGLSMGGQTITNATWNATTIGTAYGGTGLTSFTANGVVYASSTSALTTGSALVFDGTNLLVGTPTAYAPLSVAGSIAPVATPSASWGIDFASSTAPPNYVTLAASATYDLANGSGLVILHNNFNGFGAVFFTYAGNTVKIAGDASIVAGTGGASQIGITYNPGNGKYRINNGYATSQSIFITTIRTRTAS